MDSTDRTNRQSRLTKVVAMAAVALGLAGGSYGIASAASGSGSSSSGSSSSSSGATTQSAAPAQAPNAQHPWGGQRSDETLLTGDTKAKVEAAAKAELSGATIERVETDADGNAKYEAHVVKSDGTPATVYVDEDFNVVSVESR
jgi:uncharacterized membrane protein YkoI